jgi:fibronectin-binding autotransporter adhesin
MLKATVWGRATATVTLARLPWAAGLVAGVLAALPAGPALAQTRGSWNVDADGLWSVNTNWLNNTIAGGISGTATFANNITATRTVTLDTSRSLGSFIFGDADTSSAASWIVTSSTTSMTMDNRTNSATITVNALGTGATATISSTLAASGTTPSIIKDGPGTLTLGATNTFTTKLAITAGTLQISADRNLGAIGTFATDRITISNGATLRTGAAFTLSGSRGLTIGSGGGTISVNGGILTMPVRVTGSGNTATVTGSNSLVLQNTSGTASDVNWDFSANNGIRALFEGVNALGTGSVVVRNGVRLMQSGTASGAGTITNPVTLESGAGLTARVAATFSNVIFPTSGTVVLNKDDQATATLTITSSGSLAGNLTIDTTQGGSNSVGSVFLDGVFSGSGGLVKTGTGASGLLILRGANTYTGTTAINSGTLQLGNGGTVGRLSPSSVITGSAGGTIVFNRSDTISSGTHFTSVIGGAINVTKSGSGILLFGGSNTYTGNTTINTGTLRLGTAGSIANSGTISVANGAFLDISAVSGGYSLAAAQWLQGSGTVLGDVSALGTIAPGLSGSAGTLSFANAVALGAGSILSYGLNGTDTTAGGGINDLSSVASNLTLAGTLNISEIGVGSFLSATQGSTWRLFDYTGSLADNGLSLGTTPALSPGLNFSVDTSTPNQVNLIVVPEPAVIAPTLFGLVAVWVVRARRRRTTVGA